jgi:superfamily II DNA or RNA helicase
MLKKLEIEDEYLPDTESSPETFYRSVISEANFYRRAAGYFSSGIFNLFRIEYLDFALRGGKIELVCSNHLTIDDIQTLQNHELEKRIDRDILEEVKLMEINDLTNNALSFFATLLKNGTLKIKIASYTTGGLFHDKTGIFSDELNNYISFRGSSNETYMGWSEEGNFETLETFCSWKIEDEKRVNNHKKYLKNIWNNKHSGLEVLKLSDVSIKKLISKAHDEIDDFRPILERNAAKKEKNKNQRTLMPFQLETINNWKKNMHKGIIQHATGSGKTVTAINAISEHSHEGFATVIAVPSVLLLKQWREEILKDLPGVTLLLCGGGNTKWKQKSRIRSLLLENKDGSGAVIIALLNTFVTPDFMYNLKNLEDVLLVADETHTLGSLSYQKILDLNFGKRLGLSATPERYGDVDGTQKILKFYDKILSPIITIEDAITNKRLVNYIYNPVTISLNEDEMKNWRSLTQKIISAGFFLKDKTLDESNENIKMLRIRRSRIAKKASNKVPIATSIVLKEYNEGEYWLLYCEDIEQLNHMNDILRNHGMSPYIYHSNMSGSKESELSEYTKNGGIMLSIKCLDEGIDIPRISHALILASSQNPRQFIQRRGRVLRYDGFKDKAIIYDLFALPNSNESKMPDSLLIGELKRSAEFAKSALNKNGCLSKLRLAFLKLGLEMEDFEKTNSEYYLEEFEED